jgi:hypothetical protein
MALQPGVGLGLLCSMPPGFSIPCSVSPFVYTHLSQGGKFITVLYMGSVYIIMVLTFLDVGVGQFCSRFILDYFIYHIVTYGVILKVCTR